MQSCSLLLAGDGRSAARHRPSGRQGAGARSVRRQQGACSTGCPACSTMPASPSATSSLRTDWYMGDHGWHDRNNALSRSCRGNCSSKRRRAAIAKAGLTPRPDRRRGHRLDHRHRHAEPRSARRRRGSACATTSAACRCSASAAPAASAAWRRRRGWPAAEPGSNWLFVTVETCSISIRLDSDDPAAIVATALFGDGAAAAVVTGRRAQPRAHRRLGGEAVARHAARSWAGTSRTRASPSSSTAPSRRSSSASWPLRSTACSASWASSAATSTASAATPAGSR